MLLIHLNLLLLARVALTGPAWRHEARVQKSPSAVCSMLSSELVNNETFAPTSPDYTTLYEVSWSETCWLPPACIVTPANEQDLARALSTLIQTQTKFAVRSGGHSSSPGFSSIGSDGVLISLQNFNTLTLNPGQQSVIVGTGNRWGDVYTFVGNYGLTVIGVRDALVGVGGSLLGGGLSMFYNTFGLGLDNIIRYKVGPISFRARIAEILQVVLTNGTVVNATQTENPNLFRGLKGGMSNFGIVVEFEITTFTSANFQFGIVEFAPNNTEAVLEAYANYLMTNPDSQSNVEINIIPTATLILYGKLGQTNDLSYFKDFASIPVLAELFPYSNATIQEVLAILGSQETSPGGTYGSALSHKVVNSNFFLQSYQEYLEATATSPPGVSITLVPQGITTNLVAVGNAQNGGNILGLSEVPQAWVSVLTGYSNLNWSKTANAMVDNLVSSLKLKAEAQDIALPFLYPNDASALENVLAGYGCQNLNFIKAVAEQYDPMGYMQSLQNDGFLVSRA